MVFTESARLADDTQAPSVFATPVCWDEGHAVPSFFILGAGSSSHHSCMTRNSLDTSELNGEGVIFFKLDLILLSQPPDD